MWKKLVCLLSAVAILFGAMGLAGCVNEEASARKNIKNNAGIEIPDDAKLEYRYAEESGVIPVHGRKAHYAVFTFDNDPVDWLEENNFSEAKDTDFEHGFLDSAWGLVKVLGEKVPDEQIPNFQNIYLWLQANGVYFAYFPEQSMLMVYSTPS